MRILSLALGLAAVLASASADDNDDTKKAGKLAVGDKAPAIKVDKWLQGDEVKSFEKDRVYVVEFWATWCGPCIVMMPHLSDLQQEYKSKGVTFIGFTSKGRNNSEEKVAEFVKKRGPKLKYTFAYSDGSDTNDAYMTAAGRTGIPCCFVVDKSSKIAYIGHPMFLDVVLPKVVDGTWKYDRSLAEIAKVEKSVNKVFGSLRGDPEDALKTIEDFKKANPKLNKIPYFVGPKLGLLLQVKKTDEAKKMAEDVLARAIKQDDPMPMRTVSAMMRTGEAKENKELLKLSLKAAEAYLKVSGEKDTMALLNLAETHIASGDKAKAKEHGQKALDNAATPAQMRAVSVVMRTGGAKEDKDLLKLSLKAAEAFLKASGEKDAIALFNLAEAHFASGDKAKAKEYGQKAIDNAPNAAMKKQLEQRVKLFDEKDDA